MERKRKILEIIRNISDFTVDNGVNMWYHILTTNTRSYLGSKILPKKEQQIGKICKKREKTAMGVAVFSHNNYNEAVNYSAS